MHHVAGLDLHNVVVITNVVAHSDEIFQEVPEHFSIITINQTGHTIAEFSGELKRQCSQRSVINLRIS